MASLAVGGATPLHLQPRRRCRCHCYPSLASSSSNYTYTIPHFLTRIPPWRPITSVNFPTIRRLQSFISNSSSADIKVEKLPDDHSPQLKRKTLRELCGNAVPQHILRRAEEVGFVVPTGAQEQALPVVLSGLDCIIHAQTGSGKTLAYLLAIFACINAQRTNVQALIIIPTRELGMQVTKVARILAASFPKNIGSESKGSVNVMALLDGGTLKRQKSWLKAEPPHIMVATLGCLCQLLEKEFLKLDGVKVLVIDEVDSIFGAAKQTYLLRKLLTSYTSVDKRQTIFASASIPQHKRFIEDCIQHKWTKRDVVHVHVHPIEPMPLHLSHRYVMCQKTEKLDILVSLLKMDTPKSAIIFVNDQSEKSKRAGLSPTTNAVVEHLKHFHSKFSGQSYEISDILLLEEDMNINARSASLSEVRQGGHLLIATDLAARGLDLPETSHIYNFDLPKSATGYLHRAGRTARKPFSKNKCMVTNLVITEELFVLKRIENELSFACQEITL